MRAQTAAWVWAATVFLALQMTSWTVWMRWTQVRPAGFDTNRWNHEFSVFFKAWVLKRLIFFFIRRPFTNLCGNTAQPFPRLPGRHPGHRCGPGHPGEWEYGGGRGRADAQPAGGAELRHPERHGVYVSSHQDRQGELPDVVIKAPASSSSSSVPSELLPALACEGFMDAFKDTAASVSGLLPLLQRGGSSSSEACCALLFLYFVLLSFILSVSSRLAHEQTITQGSLVLFCISVGGWRPS